MTRGTGSTVNVIWIFIQRRKNRRNISVMGNKKKCVQLITQKEKFFMASLRYLPASDSAAATSFCVEYMLHAVHRHWAPRATRVSISTWETTHTRAHTHIYIFVLEIHRNAIQYAFFNSITYIHNEPVLYYVSCTIVAYLQTSMSLIVRLRWHMSL